MDILNIEIKARCKDPKKIEMILKNKAARYIGEDDQTDTYFKVHKGRLKLRQGTIENSLIRYFRPETEGLKTSVVKIYKATDRMEDLKEILSEVAGIDIVVEKKRKIFFLDNVKFHIDNVKGLGNFVEIEAISEQGKYSKEKLSEQCKHYMDLLGIRKKDLIAASYSDILYNGK